MQTTARWILVTVLALDVVFGAVLLSGGLSAADAAPETAPDDGTPTTPQGDLDTEGSSEFSSQALQELGRQMAERAAELERRETEIEELLRGNEVLRRAGVLQEGQQTGAEDTPPTPAPDRAAAARASTAFLALQKAYENMEPESAARALAELANRDKQVVVALLLGWKPRTSGAILDALTQNDPALAAELSYEIWKLGGES